MMFTISEYFKLNIQTQMKIFIHCPVSVDRAYLQCLGKLQEWVPHTKTKKRVHINICPQTVFKVQLNSVLASVLYILSLGTLHNDPSVFTFSWTWTDTSPTHILYLSNHFQPPRGLLKGCISPWSDVSMNTLIQGEERLS